MTVQFASADAQGEQGRGMAGVVGVAVSNTLSTRNITMQCTTLDSVITDERFVHQFRDSVVPAATERARISSIIQGGKKERNEFIKKKHNVDFMSLDIEGAEAIALRGVDWTTTQIDVILAEAKADTTHFGEENAGPPLIPIFADLGCVAQRGAAAAAYLCTSALYVRMLLISRSSSRCTCTTATRHTPHTTRPPDAHRYTVAFQVGEDLIFIHNDAPPVYRTRAAAFIARQNDATPCIGAPCTSSRICNCAKKSETAYSRVLRELGHFLQWA